MNWLDYSVLAVYFLVMTLIGVLSMLKVKKQEDFFLGSRTFGRLFQAFAAFGAGTGSQDPVTIGRTTFTSGLSGIWSVLLWLFVTPFYWFTAVWYRRMRHITMGDWFVERYHSKGMGFAYMLFSLAFYAAWLGVGFTAIGKVGAPLLEDSAFVEEGQMQLFGYSMPVEHALVYICAGVVLIYGVLGGLRAAYWTDVIQGMFIILLSVLLIPMGLRALADKDAEIQGVDKASVATTEGFRVMHDRVPDEYFEIIESPRGGEFPLYYIIAITILNLVAIVVHPHMAVTGGGSAKTEDSARVGLVVGNFLKRFCTIGWCITILIVLAYMAGSLEIAEDPDKTWGIAAREILSPYGFGLVGLMLACLMAALMSSASAYMLVVSGLVVRNFYAAYVDDQASERTYVLLGRVISALVIVAGAWGSLVYMDVLEQLEFAWEVPLLFASLFWVGMFWRRTTKWAAWGTLLFTLGAFVVVPWLLPKYVPELAEDPKYAVANDFVTTIVTREATHVDVERREAEIKLWHKRAKDWVQEQEAAQTIGPRPEVVEVGQMVDDPLEPGGREATREHARLSEAKLARWTLWLKEWKETHPLPDALTPQQLEAVAKALGPCPEPVIGNTVDDEFPTGGKAIFWTDGVEPIGEKRLKDLPTEEEDGQETNVRVTRQQYDCALKGKGWFQVDFLLYDLMGIDLAKMPDPALKTLRLPTRVILPFLVLIVLSLITPRGKKEELDRFYVKMKTPVNPDPVQDQREMTRSYEDPSRFDDKRLIKACGLEFQKPNLKDIVGFVVCFLICFGLIGLTVWLAKLGT
ncbi:MAG: sodium:solute symporter family protein [Planctomycetota bacterium]|jgi:SSS family solute:Na+ symporter